jgi:hypothetical protein
MSGHVTFKAGHRTALQSLAQGVWPSPGGPFRQRCRTFSDGSETTFSSAGGRIAAHKSLTTLLVESLRRSCFGCESRRSTEVTNSRDVLLFSQDSKSTTWAAARLSKERENVSF